jgi:hypothetical protein
MAQQVGAELWHMNNFANAQYGVQGGGLDNPCLTSPYFPFKDYIFIAADGKRYMYEEMLGLERHGKYIYNGSSTNARRPTPNWAVFGAKSFGDKCVIPETFCGWLSIFKEFIASNNQGYLDAGVLVSGNTPEELAEKIGVDAAALKATIEDYNANAAIGVDPDFNRGTNVYSAFNLGAQIAAGHEGTTDIDTDTTEVKPSIAAFSLEQLEAPYYALRLYIGNLNSQGGPKRSEKGEVLGVNGQPIPRLYAAGELGTIYSFNYNGGGNFSEALSSGRLAARSIAALDFWEAQ